MNYKGVTVIFEKLKLREALVLIFKKNFRYFLNKGLFYL